MLLSGMGLEMKGVTANNKSANCLIEDPRALRNNEAGNVS